MFYSSEHPNTIKMKMFYFKSSVAHKSDKLSSTGLGSSVGRVSAPRSAGTGFDPGPRNTKVVNNCTSCFPLSTRIFRVGLGLVAPVSV